MAFQSIIHLFTNENHFITAMPFDFRQDSNLKNLICNFDKLALIHSDFSGNPNFEECFRRSDHEISEAYKHKDLLFATVAELAQKRFSRKIGSPFKVLFSYSDEYASNCRFNCLTMKNILVERGVADFDLFLALSKDKEKFIGALEYNNDLFDRETTESFVENYIKFIESAVAVPNFLVTQYLLKGRLAQNYEEREDVDDDERVAITASFPIMPIEDPLMFWFGELDMPVRFEFTPSSNILEQLLVPDGLFLNEDNKFNIVLFRLEDLFYLNNSNNYNSDEIVTFPDRILSKNIDDFIGAIQICLNRTATPFIVGICPSSPNSELYNKHSEILRSEEKRLIGLLKDLGDVYIIKENKWLDYYNVKDLFEDEIDDTGYISYIFLDDNPVECAEVRANCPEVLTLEIPGNPQRIPDFLENIWAFDTLGITEEDELRNRMYEENDEREYFKEQTIDFDTFLKGLNLKVDIEPLSGSVLTRSSQMTQRINQFNFTSKERNETELKELCFSGPVQGWVVDVDDRFGKYGLVGFMITQPANSNDGLEIESFMISCRVLGRGGEHKMLSYVGNIALECTTNMDLTVSERIDYISKNYQNVEQVVREMNNKMGVRVEESIDYIMEPKTETEEILSAIWKECLNLENPGIFDDFFDVGGHSIAGIKIVLEINSRFGIELAYKRFLDSPNIATIASIIDNSNEYSTSI